MMPPGAGVRASRDLKAQLADLHVFFSEVQTEKEALANLDLFSPPSQRRRPRKPFLEPPLPAAQQQQQPQAPAIPTVPVLPKAIAKPRELIFYKPKLDNGARTPIEEANMLAQPLATPSSPSMQCSGVSEEDDASDSEEVTWSADHARLVNLLCGKAEETQQIAPAEPAPAVTATTDGPQLASPRLSGAPSSVIVPRCLEFGGCSVDSGDGTPKIAASRPAESAPVAGVAAGRIDALSRLKQRSVARQSDRLSSSVHRLKQITALKQRARLAAAASMHSAPPPRAHAPAPAVIAPAADPAPVLTATGWQSNQLTESALAPLGAAAARAAATAAAAAGAEEGTAKRPYLKRRSQMQPIQQMPDWSAVRPKTSSRLDSNLILRPRRDVAQAPQQQLVAAATAPRPATASTVPRPATAATAKKPWNSNRDGPSPYASTSTRPLGAARAALGGTKPLSAAQQAARTTTFVVPPPVAAAPSCGPLGAAAAAQSQFSSMSAFTGGSNHRMGPSRGSAWDPRPTNGACGASGNGTPLEDPLGPLVSQVEQLLSSIEKSIRR